MFTAKDHDLLCRMEGDAPIGQIMRRHWLPACLSEQVGECDERAIGHGKPCNSHAMLTEDRRTLVAALAELALTPISEAAE